MLASCIVKEDVKSNLPNILNGSWYVNDNLKEKLSFETNGKWIYELENDTVYGTYIVEVEQQSTPYFIWNSQESIHKILWKDEKGETGETIWIGYSDYGCDKIILKNIYNHDNEISVLTKE